MAALTALLLISTLLHCGLMHASIAQRSRSERILQKFVEPGILATCMDDLKVNCIKKGIPWHDEFPTLLKRYVDRDSDLPLVCTVIGSTFPTTGGDLEELIFEFADVSLFATLNDRSEDELDLRALERTAGGCDVAVLCKYNAQPDQTRL